MKTEVETEVFNIVVGIDTKFYSSDIPTWARKKISDTIRSELVQQNISRIAIFHVGDESNVERLLQRANGPEIDHVNELVDELQLLLNISENMYSDVSTGSMETGSIFSQLTTEKGTIDYNGTITIGWKGDNFPSEEKRRDILSEEIMKYLGTPYIGENEFRRRTIRKAIKKAMKELYDNKIQISVIVKSANIDIDENVDEKWISNEGHYGEDESSDYVIASFKEFKQRGINALPDRNGTYDVDNFVIMSGIPLEKTGKIRLTEDEVANIAAISHGKIYLCETKEGEPALLIRKSRGNATLIKDKEVIRMLQNIESTKDFIDILHPNPPRNSKELQEKAESLGIQINDENNTDEEIDEPTDVEKEYLQDNITPGPRVDQIGNTTKVTGEDSVEWPAVGEKLELWETEYELGKGVKLRELENFGKGFLTTDSGRVIISEPIKCQKGCKEQIPDLLYMVKARRHSQPRFILTIHPNDVHFTSQNIAQEISRLADEYGKEAVEMALSDFISPASITRVDSDTLEKVKDNLEKRVMDSEKWDENDYNEDIERVNSEQMATLTPFDVSHSAPNRREEKIIQGETVNNPDEIEHLSEEVYTYNLYAHGSGGISSVVLTDKNGKVLLSIPVVGYGESQQLEAQIENLIYPVIGAANAKNETNILTISGSVHFITDEGTSYIQNLIKEKNKETIRKNLRETFGSQNMNTIGKDALESLFEENAEKKKVRAETELQTEQSAVNNDAEQGTEIQIDDTSYIPVKGDKFEEGDTVYTLNDYISLQGKDSSCVLVDSSNTVISTIKFNCDANSGSAPKELVQELLHSINMNNGGEQFVISIEDSVYFCEENAAECVQELSEKYNKETVRLAILSRYPIETNVVNVTSSEIRDSVDKMVEASQTLPPESIAERIDGIKDKKVKDMMKSTQKGHRKYQRKKEYQKALSTSASENGLPPGVIPEEGAPPFIQEGEDEEIWPIPGTKLVAGETIESLNYGLLLVGYNDRFVITNTNREVICPVVFSSYRVLYPGLIYELNQAGSNETIYVVVNEEEEFETVNSNSAYLIKKMAQEYDFERVAEAIWGEEMTEGSLQEVGEMLENSEIIDQSVVETHKSEAPENSSSISEHSEDVEDPQGDDVSSGKPETEDSTISSVLSKFKDS